MKRKMTALFLAVTMIFSFAPNVTVFAEGTDNTSNTAEITEDTVPVEEENSSENVETDKETTTEEEAGTEQETDKNEVFSNDAENAGQGNINNDEQKGGEEKSLNEKNTDVPLSYTITNENFEQILEVVKGNLVTQGNIEFVLSEDISGQFTGVSDRHITVKSSGDHKFSINLGSELAGDITLDNVTVSANSQTIYATGHMFETTANFDGTIGTIYGGGKKGQDVENTNLILIGGTYSAVYGGGLDSAVSGNTNVTVDGNITISKLYGGGHAKETASGTVGGNVNLQLKSGTIGSFLGGGQNESLPDTDRSPAKVNGTVSLTAGYAGAEDKTIQLATNGESGAGSENSTVGNVDMKLLDGSYTDLRVGGAGFSDDVNGTVKIELDGCIVDMAVLGAGIQDYRDANIINGYRTRILNTGKEANAIQITIKNSDIDCLDALGMGYSSQKYDLISGGVSVDISNSFISQLSVGGYESNGAGAYGELQGDATIKVNSSDIHTFYGHYDNFEDKSYKTNLIFDGDGESTAGLIQYVDNVTVQNNADVTFDRGLFKDDTDWYVSTYVKPFYNTRNLNITSGGKLTTQNDDVNQSAEILNNAVIDGGEWVAKSYMKVGNDKEAGNLTIKDGGKLMTQSQAWVTGDATLEKGTWTVDSKNRKVAFVYGNTSLKDSTVTGNSNIQWRGEALADNSKINLNNSATISVYKTATIKNNSELTASADVNLKDNVMVTDSSITVNGTGGFFAGETTKENSKLTMTNSTLTAPEAYVYGDASLDKSSWTAGGTENNSTVDGDLTVTDNSTLNVASTHTFSVKKNSEIKNSIVNGKGRLYFYNKLTSENTTLTFDDVIKVGYEWEDGAKQTGYSLHDAWSSTNDTVICNLHKHETNKVSGKAVIIGGTWTLFQPMIIFGDYNGTNNTLNLPAFVGPDNYPVKAIPLGIAGKANGKTDVYLVQSDDAGKEGQPVVGHNYINATKDSEYTFTLSNKNANNGEYFFKRVDDAITENSSNYDMWQVAKKDSYQVIYSFVSGTRGKSLPDEITDLLPVDSNQYVDGSMVTAIQPEKTTVQVADGVWTFKGYDEESIMASKDHLNGDGYIAFKGTWIFEKNKYSVTYEFVSGTKDKELPDEVTALLPSDSKTYEHGKTVTAIQPDKTSVAQDDGVWVFEGYDENKKVATSALTFIGTWKFYEYQEVTANDLTVYEGGLGSDGNGETGDALPEPAWKGQFSEHTVTVGGEEWNVEEKGLPFTWKYLNEDKEEVTTSARVGIYSLYVYPLETLEDVPVIIDNAYVLNLPKDGLEVSKITVRDVTNNEHADNLSTETFKNVYNYAPSQEPTTQGFIKNMIATFASLFDDSALDGTFDTTTGTHNDDCDPEEPHAHVEKGTTFLKNGKEDMPVGEDAKIGLLWDNFLPDVLGSETRMEKLHNKSLEAVGNDTFDTNGTIHRDFKYIDLVDMTDGNVWVGTLSRDVTVYYPYPDGVDKNDDIAITYYDGLTRDYTIDMTEESLDKEIDGTSAHTVKNFQKTENGILFDVPSKQFGPIEVMWQKSYTPDYEFVSGTKDKELPDSVKTLEPKADKAYVEGTTITAPEIETKEVKTDDGVWVFHSWDAQSKVSANGVKFTGTWEFRMNAGTINQMPEITAEDKTLTVGDTFDPKKEVTATDKEDGDITDKIEVISNNVDTTKAGTYEVTYKVTDSQGASSTKTITVTVTDKTEEIPVPDDNEKPNTGDTGNTPSPDKGTSSSTSAPTTGDNTNVLFYAALLFLSGIACVGALIRRRKR